MNEDDIGLWNPLGSINVTRYKWLRFSTIATGGNTTFRAYFDATHFQRLPTYFLFRQRFITESSDQVGIPIRVSPSSIPVVFELKIPEELAERGVYHRHIEVYRVVTRRSKYVGLTTDMEIIVMLEELWG